jgi:hypothetical protein
MIGFALAMQLAAAAAGSTPPGGDTTGYWQQRVEYSIVVHLDEGLMGFTAQGRLRYVNNSPDTLREMYFHQYLNAFKPGSKWSAADEREHRVRFQNLQEPYYGYERFTRAPSVDGVPTLVDYPGSPDSTVVHLRLPKPLAPGDSVAIDMAWEGRPSVVPRRQARRGRTYDLAQWYPKVAVYDRGGWQPNAFQPAGELYGEFGTYDVTIVARDDQVIAATGIVVSGDPGWARVSRTGQPWRPRPPATLPDAPVVIPPAHERAVRFLAEHVHHFAWSASPDYVYEGTTYVRPAGAAALGRADVPIADTVGVNVLYKPGDDSTWGGGAVVKRMVDALAWLEHLYGPYAYPQITNVHRIDPGGTEFPMMIMTGSPSYGLILHELGHVFSYGILANNEWRSGWMDEGLTDYQTYWAQQLSPQDRQPRVFPTIGAGYRANATTTTRSDSVDFESLRLELMGRAQPPGTVAHEFSEFGIYNRMIYDRARIMYGHLRELMGDSVFIAFLHDYYARWAFRHVDERAMRASAERAYGKDLGWFFQQWVHGTGLLNYGMGADTSVCRDGAGSDRCVTRVRVTKHGELRHPMPVGVHTATGWHMTRAKAELDDQWVDVASDAKPDSIALDPFHATWDWDWRDNTDEAWVGTIHAPDVVVDWPFLEQENRSRTIVAVAPRLWYSGPQGLIVGGSARTNYMGLTDLHHAVVGAAFRAPNGTSAISQLQLRVRADDMYLAPFMRRPLMGVAASANYVDGIARGTLTRRWDLSPFVYANGPAIHAAASVSGTYPVESLLLPEQWDDAHVTEISGRAEFVTPRRADSASLRFTLDAAGGYEAARAAGVRSGGYGRALASLESFTYLTPGQRALTIRVNGGAAPRAPAQRGIFASTADPFETFDNDLWRPRGAALKQEDFMLMPVGGARLRGFSPGILFDRVVSGNVDLDQRLATLSGAFGNLSIWAGAFADAGLGGGDRSLLDGTAALVDLGASIRVRGRFYDRDVDVRLSIPVAANDPFNVPVQGLSRLRWTFEWR